MCLPHFVSPSLSVSGGSSHTQVTPLIVQRSQDKDNDWGWGLYFSVLRQKVECAASSSLHMSEFLVPSAHLSIHVLALSYVVLVLLLLCLCLCYVSALCGVSSLLSLCVVLLSGPTPSLLLKATLAFALTYAQVSSHRHTANRSSISRSTVEYVYV